MSHDFEDTLNDYISIFTLFFLSIVVIFIIYFSFIINKNIRFTYILLNLLISNLLLCFCFRLSIFYTTYDIPQPLCKTQSIFIGVFGNSNDVILFSINLICYKIINEKNLILEKIKTIKFFLFLIMPYFIFSIVYVVVFLIYHNKEYSFNEIFCFGAKDSINDYLSLDIVILYFIKVTFLILDFVYIIKIIDCINIKKDKNKKYFAIKMLSYIIISLVASLVSFIVRIYLVIKKKNDDDYRNTNWPYLFIVYSYTAAGYLLSIIYMWNSGLYKYCKINKGNKDSFRDSINELSENDKSLSKI